MEWISVQDKMPVDPGFYATHYFWEKEEGSLTGIGYYSGEEWGDGDKPNLHWSGPFSNEDEAWEWADSHDEEITW